MFGKSESWKEGQHDLTSIRTRTIAEETYKGIESDLWNGHDMQPLESFELRNLTHIFKSLLLAAV